MSGSNSIPLAEKLRPETIENFFGQERAQSRVDNFLKTGKISNLLLFGPPGCGKSTLALLLARASGKRFARISAPEAGVAQLRTKLADVDVLILDELHRFSKAQQDFFLPLLENGSLILVATTTENPSFSVTRQLLSRLHVVRLEPLDRKALLQIGRRGLEAIGADLPAESLDMLVSQAGGDGRTLLNLIEFVSSLPQRQKTPQALLQALPEALTRHDKQGDSHYEYISALIKSIRGSDPDAALYYLACLLEGGEDPRFICRRLILSASEDIGLADPHALPMAVACQQAVEFTGMPEAVIPLAETTVYLALARKSNSTYAGYLAAAREIKKNGKQPVPMHLRNASTAMQKSWGYGEDYKYPHNWPTSWVEQKYLPKEVAEARFYQPRQNGQEPALSAWWRKLHKRADN